MPRRKFGPARFFGVIEAEGVLRRKQTSPAPHFHRLMTASCEEERTSPSIALWMTSADLIPPALVISLERDFR